MEQLKKTQHYSTNADKILGNLKQYIPKNTCLIEPFYGNGDMSKRLEVEFDEKYDIDSSESGVVKKDTLKNPPNYKGKFIITNPPYLAKNKASEKEIFNMYNMDDLYKISLKSFIGCLGGIVIVPTNFFTDERTSELRKEFLSNYEILEMNVFKTPVFESTTYSVCAFAFTKGGKDQQKFTINIFPEQSSLLINLSRESGYRIGGEFFNLVEKEEELFGRALIDSQNNGKKFITNLKLTCIDTREKRLGLEYCEKTFYGKNTDRTYATFTTSEEITIYEELEIVRLFNIKLEEFRKNHGDLALTNYRDFNRKRIGFSFAYKLASLCLKEIRESNN